MDFTWTVKRGTETTASFTLRGLEPGRLRDGHVLNQITSGICQLTQPRPSTSTITPSTAPQVMAIEDDRGPADRAAEPDWKTKARSNATRFVHKHDMEVAPEATAEPAPPSSNIVRPSAQPSTSARCVNGEPTADATPPLQRRGNPRWQLGMEVPPPRGVNVEATAEVAPPPQAMLAPPPQGPRPPAFPPSQRHLESAKAPASPRPPSCPPSQQLLVMHRQEQNDSDIPDHISIPDDAEEHFERQDLDTHTVSVDAVWYAQKSIKQAFSDGKPFSRLIQELKRGVHDPLTADFLMLVCLDVGGEYFSLNNRRLYCLKEHAWQMSRDVEINIKVVGSFPNWDMVKMCFSNFDTKSKGRILKVRGRKTLSR